MVVGVRSCGCYGRCITPMNVDCGTSTSSRPMLPRYRQYAQLEPFLLHKRFRVPGLLIRSRELVLTRSSPRNRTRKDLQNVMDEECSGMDEEWSGITRSEPLLLSMQPSLKGETEALAQEDLSGQPPNLGDNTSFKDGSGYFNGGDGLSSLSEKEINRRQKIGAKNRGNVPWNKGRPFDEETKRLIRKRTSEALRDPKVSKKMLGFRQSHREESKEKISTAVRKLWEKRVVSVRSRQKALSIWANTIAEAAKQGGHGQDKLDWDSYARIKADMVSECIRKAHDKARAREARKLEKAEQNKRSKPKKSVLVVSASSKLKERLTKLHRRKKKLEVAISLRKRRKGSQNVTDK